MPSGCCGMLCGSASTYRSRTGTRAGAACPGAREEAGRGRAPPLEDRTRKPAVLDHDGRGCGAAHAAGAGARGLRAAAAVQPGDERLLRLSSATCEVARAARRQRGRLQAGPRRQSAQGAACWSLADLKNYTFSDAEFSAMQGCCGTEAWHAPCNASCTSRSARPASTGAEYPGLRTLRAGQRAAPLGCPFRHRELRAALRAHSAFFGPKFFAAHAGGGNPSCAPIFIVGLPRSGSTLVEQILASHSPVEGTMELPTSSTSCSSSMTWRAKPRRLSRGPGALARPRSSPRSASATSPTTAPLRSGRAALHRQAAEQLPARRPDPADPAQRHDHRRAAPSAGACFQAFKQHFAPGQSFSYDLARPRPLLSRLLSLMDHFDAVLPGRVLPRDLRGAGARPEAEIRRLLAHCGLPFEPACLELPRAPSAPCAPPAPSRCASPSTLQAVAYWRHFETELEPLRAALGDALTRFA